MSTTRHVFHEESSQILCHNSRWCDGFFSRMRGFTWHRRLADGESLVLVHDKDSRVDTSITMLFVFFDLGVLWVNSEGVVVETLHAKAWRPSYVGDFPARYVVEAHPDILRTVKAGDHIRFLDPTDAN